MATETPKSATTEAKATTTTAPGDAAAGDARIDKAQAIVRRNVMWALGIGIVPLPIVDFLGITGVQIKLLKELSDLYGVKYTESAIKKVTLSLFAGLGSAGLGIAASSALKFLPIVGTSLGLLSLPVVAGAVTMATGRVFIAHFESGGTILNFDAKAMRAHFRAEFERAKETVTHMKKDEVTKPAAAAAPAAAAPPAGSPSASAAR